MPESGFVFSLRARLTRACALPLLLACSCAAEGAERSTAEPSWLSGGMHWRLVGPFRGGRSLAVSGVPGDPATFYFGGVAGGVWKTTDGGWNWSPLTDASGPVSVGSLAVSPSDPRVLYVGAGEACIRGNITFGDGVWKSLDAGKSWVHLGLADTRQIGKVAVDPRDPNTVFVAALGHAFGPNEERGVYRTRDGGKSWKRVLFHDARTGAIDVAIDPENPQVVFAALWQAERTPYSLESGGPGSGLYRSVDGGESWTRLGEPTSGLPTGLLGRIGLALAPSHSQRVYAMVEAKEGGLFRSDDGGTRWTRVNDDQRFRQRAWYFSHLTVDPRSPDTVYVMNTGLFRSTDGGKSFQLLPAPHGDHHALWIDPSEPRRMINANDGGATISFDGGAHWTRQDTQPTAQLYHVVADNDYPYKVYGAQQDNSALGIASGEDDEGVLSRKDWFYIGGGESGSVAVDPRDPQIIYAGNGGGQVTRLDRRYPLPQDVSPWPLDLSGHGAADEPHRFQWTEPIVISPHDPEVLYTAGETALRSTDRGHSWQAISPDLTRNDRGRQQASGGPITKDNTGVEVYDTVFALAESPKQKGLLWAGTDDGLIHLTRDGGKSWQNVTPRSLPAWSLVSLIEASPHEACAAYAAIDRHRLDDLRPMALRTRDCGKSWTRIDAGLPAQAVVHAVREDPARRGLLYAGTELGVFFSLDDGGGWQPLQLDLPVTPVHDLVVKGSDLVAATHGRSFWILDDLSPLRMAERRASALALFAPRPQVRLHAIESADRRRPVGEDPPQGAVLEVWLAKAPTAEVALEIRDAQGKLLRRLSTVAPPRPPQPQEWPDQQPLLEKLDLHAGLNRIVWDLRTEAPTFTPAFYAGNGPEGPIVPAGDYRVRLVSATARDEQVLRVLPDPRFKGSAQDTQASYALLLQVRERFDALHRAVNQLRDLGGQLRELRQRCARAGQKELAAQSEALDGRAREVMGQLLQVESRSSEGTLNYPTRLNEQLEYLRNSIESSDHAPTAQQRAVFELLSSRLSAQLAGFQKLASVDVPALSGQVARARVPALQLGDGTSAAAGEGEGASMPVGRERR